MSVGDPLADPAAKTVAPMKVDSQAKVANLNADKLDNKDSTEIGVNGLQRVTANSAFNSDSPKVAEARCSSGKVVVGTGFDISGGRSGDFPAQRANVVLDRVVAINNNSVLVEALEEEPVDFDWSVQALAICATAGTP